MKKFFNNLLPCLLAFFAVCLTLPTYGQEEEEEGEAGPPNIRRETDGIKSGSDRDNKVFTLNQINHLDQNNSSNDNNVSDLSVFDMHGSQVGIIKGQLSSISLQEYISKLPIQPGFYLIGYFNKTRFEMTKVYKF